MAAAPVIVSVTPAVPCKVAVAQVESPPDALGAALKRARRRTARAIVTYGPDTPWRCLGETMTALARAGFHRVTYDSPLPKSR